jgi:thiol-disulfide isomerase/thioredoxin
MENMIAKLPLLLCFAALTAGADETLPVLVINGETYSNVTVTAVTATDVFFQYAGGMGNAKLKDLDPKLQAHFHYDSAKDLQIEKQQATNNILYQQFLATNQPPPPHRDAAAAGAGEDDFVAPKINARSVCGQRPPVFVVEQWLTRKPDFTGRFIMLVFWRTSSDASRRTIPLLDSFQAEFHDRLVIVGITDETVDVMRAASCPPIEYAVAIDTQARMAQTLEITAVPHCILVDPHAFVRYEGSPAYLDDAKLEHFLTKYQ